MRRNVCCQSLSNNVLQIFVMEVKPSVLTLVFLRVMFPSMVCVTPKTLIWLETGWPRLNSLSSPSSAATWYKPFSGVFHLRAYWCLQLFCGRTTFLLPVGLYSCLNLRMCLSFIRNRSCDHLLLESTLIIFKLHILNSSLIYNNILDTYISVYVLQLNSSFSHPHYIYIYICVCMFSHKWYYTVQCLYLS